MQALRDAEKRSSTPPPPSTPLEAHLKLRFETLGRAASARPDEVCKRSLFQALGNVAADIHGQALRDSEKLQAWRWLDPDEAGCVSWEKFYRRAAALHRRLLATGNITSAIAALGEVLQVGLHASAEVRAHDAAVAAAVRASAPPTTAAPPAAAPAAAPAGASGELGEKLRASFAELATPDASGEGPSCARRASLGGWERRASRVGRRRSRRGGTSTRSRPGRCGGRATPRRAPHW